MARMVLGEMAMESFDIIRRQAELARKLVELRNGVLEDLRFTSLIDRTRHDLSRVASPVVVVVGASSAGKSTLINAVCGSNILPVSAVPTTLVPVHLDGGDPRTTIVGLGAGSRTGPTSIPAIHTLITDRKSDARYLVWREPGASRVPWKWLDMPGSSVAPTKDISVVLTPWELADVCVLATSALQPLSFSDLRQLIQVGSIFGDPTLVVALTRCDQLPAEQLASVRDYVSSAIKDAFPGRSIALLPVSSASRAGIPEFTAHLAAIIRDRQRTQLQCEIDSWRLTMAELVQLLELRELADLKPGTIEEARVQLRAALFEECRQLKLAVPRVVEEAVRLHTARLPTSERVASEMLRQALLAFLTKETNRIGRGLMSGLGQILARDLAKPHAVDAVLKRVGAISTPNLPGLFDRETALVGLGMGAALGAIVPLLAVATAGVAVAAGLVGGLAGSLFGGFTGTGVMLSTPDDVRARVGHSLTVSAHAELDRVIALSADEIDRTAALLRRVVQVYERPEHRVRDVSAHAPMLTAARLRLAEIERELRALYPTVEDPAAKVSARGARASQHKTGRRQ